MNKQRWITVGLFSTALWLGSTIYTSADGSVGSVNDPLVTKSYVDQKIAEITGQKPAPAPSAAPSAAPVTGGTSSPGMAAAGITVVQLTKGQTIYAGASSEIIVRTGKTIAVSSDEDGIPDVTAGADIQPGTAVKNNHLLIFPREGRGVKADPKETDEIWLMVRGDYTIYNADGSKVTR